MGPTGLCAQPGVSQEPTRQHREGGPALSEGWWLLTLTHGRLENQLPLQVLGGVPSPEEEPSRGEVLEAAHLSHFQVDVLLLAEALGDLLVFNVKSLCKVAMGVGFGLLWGSFPQELV